eukprot:TRINITY_DN1982_c0_g2_i1.p1 TRINITY_DN1982_c0_g2~~TRINITY_DN1982_c0_g2_i1.p1  ORF type:complete len:258 (-),score=76.33 TRINITY_DN1982_c0_g2_i1:142-915(-)
MQVVGTQMRAKRERNVEQAKAMLNKTVSSMKPVSKTRAKRKVRVDSTYNYNERKNSSTVYNFKAREPAKEAKPSYSQYKTDTKSKLEMFTESLSPLRIVSSYLPKIANARANPRQGISTNARDVEGSSLLGADESLPKLTSFKIMPADQFTEIRFPNHPKGCSNNSQIIKVSIGGESEVLSEKQTRNEALYHRSVTSGEKGNGGRKAFTRHDDRKTIKPKALNDHYTQANSRKATSLAKGTKRDIYNNSLCIYGSSK